MLLDPRSLAEKVTAETGLAFAVTEGRDGDGYRWYELRPTEYPTGQTFTLRSVIGWRRITVLFRPGNFAVDLVEAMGRVDEAGRQIFRTILSSCLEDGADVELLVNGLSRDPEDDELWSTPWRNLELTIQRGMLDINTGDPEADMRQVEVWTLRVAAAVLALLPLEVESEETGEANPDVTGLPEGSRLRIEVNRYERNRRNRAAALAIHGYLCKACDLDMGEQYGHDAVGLIEVHHVTPVSEVVSGYIIDPKTDLVPLCPNCHAVAHRRSPPFTVNDLRDMQGIT